MPALKYRLTDIGHLDKKISCAVLLNKLFHHCIWGKPWRRLANENLDVPVLPFTEHSHKQLY